jgi:GGDEF domain-containing protein
MAFFDAHALRGLDPHERIALAVRDALPGKAGDRPLERIVAELAAVDEANDPDSYARLRIELERYIATDPVTGLPNRVRFMDDLSRAIASARRYDEPLALLVLDLAEPGADEQAAGEQLLRLVRVTDDVARIGPGRFAIILPRTGSLGCALVASRVADVEGHTFVLGNATLTRDVTDAQDLLARAETSLGIVSEPSSTS